MDVLHLILRYIHLLGFALVFGGWAASWLGAKLNVNRPMLWGTAVQVVSGALLAAPWPDVEVDHAKIGVKGVLALLLAIMVWVPELRKREKVADGHFYAFGVMVLITAGVAVFWT